MTELKTLEDMIERVEFKIGSSKEHSTGIDIRMVNLDELRQEAIKHAKEKKDRIKKFSDDIDNKIPNDSDYMVRSQMREIFRAQGALYWIIECFNLTEEDLK